MTKPSYTELVELLHEWKQEFEPGLKFRTEERWTLPERTTDALKRVTVEPSSELGNFTRKGGHNTGPSQIAQRPPAPAPMRARTARQPNEWKCSCGQDNLLPDDKLCVSCGDPP
jgi:hypothetical protein